MHVGQEVTLHPDIVAMRKSIGLETEYTFELNGKYNLMKYQGTHQFIKNPDTYVNLWRLMGGNIVKTLSGQRYEISEILIPEIAIIQE